MPVCVICSGSDFICESGFYFCSECQTQSQDVREEIHENDNAEDEGQALGGKRKKGAISSDCSTSSDGENMTSWEGFNFALAGLVDELIGLGARPELKLTILKLWTEYLRKMEVAFFSKDGPAVPKLGPNFKKYDANIIYGYTIEKKKYVKDDSKVESSIDNPDQESSDTGNTAVQRLRVLKQKRLAIRQNYEKMMQEMSLASQTLTDVTLEMLAVSEVDGDDGPRDLQFSDAAKGNQKLKGAFHCHPGLLVRNRLICLLYLALLESNENIHLSDLLRWINEGHISYSNLVKFFPPEAQLQGENYNLFAAHQPSPPYKIILSATQRIAAYIGLKSLRVPNLKNLIKHYIKELNLPAQVGLLAERLLEILPNLPKSIPVSPKTALPNWEGRAMAHIVVALKLLFGLDDATEHRNSRIARKINSLIASEDEHLKLFVWDDWERFSILRLTAFSLFHKSSFLKRKLSTSVIQNVQPFLTEWNKSNRSTPRTTKRSAVVLDTYKHFFAKLEDRDRCLHNFKDYTDDFLLNFPACLTPYSLYTEIITKDHYEGRIRDKIEQQTQIFNHSNFDLLKENFLDTSVDYLTHPNEYIEWAQNHGLGIGLHSGAANNFMKVLSREANSGIYRNNFFRVKVYLDKVNAMPSPCLPKVLEKNKSKPRPYTTHRPLILPKVEKVSKKGALPHVKDMEVHKGEEHEIVEATAKVKRGRGRPKIQRKSFDPLRKEDEDNMLHIPHTEYWMLHIPIHSDNDFMKEAWQLPQSFVHLLEQCSSLLEMHPSALYKEVLFLEVLHKDLSLNLPSLFDSKNTVKNVHTSTDAGNENRLKWFKQSW